AHASIATDWIHYARVRGDLPGTAGLAAGQRLDTHPDRSAADGRVQSRLLGSHPSTSTDFARQVAADRRDRAVARARGPPQRAIAARARSTDPGVLPRAVGGHRARRDRAPGLPGDRDA